MSGPTVLVIGEALTDVVIGADGADADADAERFLMIDPSARAWGAY